MAKAPALNWGCVVLLTLSCHRKAERAGTPMNDFAVRIEGGYATANHHTSGHVFEFSIASEAPYLSDGTVRGR